MAKMGRPKSDNPKNNVVVVRFTDEEMNRIKAYAEKNNLTITQMVRKGIDNLLKTK